MTKCTRCDEFIEFKPHPNNPAKLAPFSLGGELHFARCKPDKRKVEYASLEDIPICWCGYPTKAVFWRTYENGTKHLYVTCLAGHKRAIPKCDANIALIEK